jgi:flagellar motility protein MotE (MotC chaperone)
MKDSVLELIVLVIGFIFVLYILCNLGRTDQIKKENFNVTTCPITENDYQNLTNKWNQYLDSSDPNDLIDGYSKELDKMSIKIGNKIGKCHDNDLRVNKDSDGDCPNCQYAKNLFRHLDFDADHNLGFGTLGQYCPNSLNYPGAQVCLQKLRNSSTDIKKITDDQRQFLINQVKEENLLLDKNMQTLEDKIDKKLERDYIKNYLVYHNNYKTTVDNYRQDSASLNNIDTMMQPPTIEEEEKKEINKFDMNITTVSKQNLSTLYDDYYFEPNHTQEVLKNVANLENNMQVTDNDINTLLRSRVVLDNTGFFILYDNDIEQNGIIIDEVKKINNIKSSENAYQIIGPMGTYNLYPVGNQLYVNVVLTGNLLPYQFISGVTYLLARN